MKENTGWTQATTDINDAMISLLSCIDSGYNAWIEIRKNGDQAFPINKKNPLLDNPFNWTSSYGIPRKESELENHKYFNETDKDLTYNWTSSFGKEEAIKLYQEQNLITDGLMLSMGINHPVRISDAIEYRKDKDGYNNFKTWVYFWKPKNDIPYWVVDESIGDVFTICYNSELINKKESLEKAGKFILEYARTIE